MTVADYGFAFVLLVVASVYESAYFWPQFRAGVAAGDPEARTRAYRRGIIGQWHHAVILSNPAEVGPVIWGGALKDDGEFKCYR